MFLILAGAVAGMLLPSQARGATPDEVDAAIQKGVKFLMDHENLTSLDEHEHFWEFQYNHQREEGGATALAVYALLAAGEEPKTNDGLAKAIDYLKGLHMTDTYAVGLRMQVWRLLPFKEVRRFVGDDGLALMGAAHPSADVKGKAFYHYELEGDDAKGPGYDHSNSQYGVLGMWALAEMGGEIPDQQWVDFDKGWRAHQLPDGGWTYQNGAVENGVVAGSTPTMTIAGIATLYITQQQVHAADAVLCKGNQVDKEIEKGLDWMVKWYGNGSPNYGAGWGNYLVYGIERIGVASGRKYFGKVDWYQDGANYLVHGQGADGGWGDSVNTAYALLFLVHGRAPVAINKLQYDIVGPDEKPKLGNWNQRPRDAANLVKWTGKQSETLLNWQTMDLTSPVEDMHDAPILYIAGDQALNFSKADEDKLRLFVEQGGLIMGSADCNGAAFAESFRKLGTKLFNGYEFATLSEKHVIYTNEQFHPDKWKNKPKVEALNNGARILMVLFPQGDPARYWQVEARLGHEELWQIADDIFLYAVDKKGLRAKGATYIVTADPKVKASKSIKVARLQYAGNWDPEPGGWRRLAAVMHNQNDTDLDVQTVKLGQGKLDSSFKIAHMTGTYAFHLDDASKAELKKFIEGGGTLVVDAAGGAGEFADSVEKEIAGLVPGSKLGVSLRAADPIFAAGEQIGQVAYRSYARKVSGDGLKWARLKAVDVADRHAIIYSSDDLSVGLVGQEVDGIIGYTPASATALMRNILCYGSGVRGAATQPDAASQPAAAKP